MAIQSKRNGMLTLDIVLFHDNARQHTVARTRAILEHLNWELFDYPPYSPGLAPNNDHLFTFLKNWLTSYRFNNNEELMEGVKTWAELTGGRLIWHRHIKIYFPKRYVPQFRR
jgi:transposase